MRTTRRAAAVLGAAAIAMTVAGAGPAGAAELTPTPAASQGFTFYLPLGCTGGLGCLPVTIAFPGS
ncbi:hypothetical protein [Williamsia deligens]|uniref:Uncharacterized protein n=1 Tax=Williamsia deligens TaxID=321325 RepID=A0ABW3G672_9NOCA|nr:hypothetical protein [Williamsia deligens]MCP2193029.1 hypothetical protein [Williamsia deligens]